MQTVSLCWFKVLPADAGVHPKGSHISTTTNTEHTTQTYRCWLFFFSKFFLHLFIAKKNPASQSGHLTVSS